jgi:thiamine-phosphate diphosphorylase
VRPRVPAVHAVTDDRVLSLSDFLARARALAGAGPVAIQLRARRVEGRRLLELATALVDAGVTLVVNDRADVARIAHAAGVHAPADGLPTAALRRLVGPEWLVGRSAHSPEEARRAATEGADYVFLGPIWPTTSHPGRLPLGLGAITAALPAPVIAIGGVTPERAAACRDAGACGVAAITALWDAADPAAAAREMLVSFGSG